MKRYFGDDEDDFDFGHDFGDYDFEDGDEISTYMDKDDLLNMMEMDLVQVELNHGMMEQAIRVAESQMFWSFRSAETKIRQIQSIYERLSEIAELEVTTKIEVKE